MNVSLHCTKCGKTYQRKSENAGKRAKCMKCGFGALLGLGALIASCSAPSSEPTQEAGPRAPARASQPDGGNHEQNSLGSDSSEGGTDLAAPVPSSWVEFTDAAGRFQCRIPPTCRPEQEESAVRRSVDFVIGDARIGVIVRTTDAPPIQQTEEITDQLRRKTAALGFTTEIRSERLTKVGGHPAADIIASVRGKASSTEMRGVQIHANGWHHAITLTSPSRSFQKSSAMFDRFLESYQVGPLKGERSAILEKKLPPELDYDLDE